MPINKHPFPRVLPIFFLLLASFIAKGAEGADPEQMNIIQTILHGGPLIVVIWLCILGTSIVMITFIIQLFLTLRKEAFAPKALVESLSNSIQAGNYQEAWEIARANKAYVANVLRGAIERIGRGKDSFDAALIEHGMREGQIVKTKISYISVIGVIAPMIGLLGTVIGMMGAFAVLGSSGVADPRGLALRIGEVLMATASGLFIAIPAFIFYYYFRNLATIVQGAADDILNRLTEDIPFEELQGIHVGEHLIGVQYAPPESTSTGSTQNIEANVEVACPVCGVGIVAGQTPCPHCGAAIDWA